MLTYFTHSLFLTCTQKIICITRIHNSIFTNIQQISIEKTLPPGKSLFTYLENQFFAHGDEFQSTLVSGLLTTAPSLGFYPFHPFLIPQFTLHYLHRRHQQSQPSWSGTNIVYSFEIFFTQCTVSENVPKQCIRLASCLRRFYQL
jgi:hypothetical protein